MRCLDCLKDIQRRSTRCLKCHNRYRSSLSPRSKPMFGKPLTSKEKSARYRQKKPKEFPLQTLWR